MMNSREFDERESLMLSGDQPDQGRPQSTMASVASLLSCCKSHRCNAPNDFTRTDKQQSDSFLTATRELPTDAGSQSLSSTTA